MYKETIVETRVEGLSNKHSRDEFAIIFASLDSLPIESQKVHVGTIVRDLFKEKMYRRSHFYLGNNVSGSMYIYFDDEYTQDEMNDSFNEIKEELLKWIADE